MRIIVNAYLVKPQTKITFGTTPDDNVIAYGAKLFFKDKNGDIEEKAQWTSDQLENGEATFTFDATGDEAYEIDLGAVVSVMSKIKTEMTFSKHPPGDDPDQLTLDPDEPGDIIRFWRFSPKS